MSDTNGVRAFFVRLAEDDEFRDSVVANPAQAMDEYGIEYDREQIPASVVLPTKESLSERLDEYLEAMGKEPVGFGIWRFHIDEEAS